MAADGQIIIDTVIDLSGINRGVSDLEKSLKGIGDKMIGVGKGLTASITLPLAGMAAAGVATATSFDDSMRKVEATMGDGLGKTIQEVASNTEQLRAKAKELGSTTAFSASQAAQGMEKLALAGWDTTQILEATGPMLNLASAGAMELDLAADIVTDTMSAFGMTADQATKATDIFAKTSSSSNTDVRQMGEAMKYAGASANAAGMDLEQTSAIIGTLGNAGIKGSSAGTVLNAMLRDLKKNAEDGTVSVGKHSIALYDQEGNMRDLTSVMSEVEDATQGMTGAQKDAALAALFGEESLRGANIMLEQGTEYTKELEQALRESSGTAQSMAEHMEGGLGGSLRGLKSALEGAAIALGEKLMPYVEKAIDFFADLALKFVNLDDRVMNIIIVLGILAASIGPLLIAGGTILTVIATMMGMAAVLGTTLMGLVGIFAAVAVGIGVLIAAGIAIYLNWETIKEKTIEIWNAIVAFLQPAIDRIVSTIQERMTVIKEWWAELQDNLLEAFTNIWNAIVTAATTFTNLLVDIFNWALPWIEMIFTTVWDTILGVIDGAINIIMGLVGVFAALFTGNWSMLWNNILTVLEGIWGVITSVISGAWELIGTIIVAAGAAIYEIVKSFLLSIWERVVAEFEKIKEAFSTGWDFVKEVFSAAMDWIKELFSSWGAAIMSVIDPIVEYWSEVFTNVWETIKEVFNAALDWVKELVARVLNSEIVTEMNKTLDHWTTIFSNIWKAIKETFTKYFDIIKEAVTTWLKVVQDNIKEKWEAVSKFFSNIWETISTTFSKVTDSIKNAVTKWIDDKKAKIEKVMKAIEKVFSNIWDSIKGAIKKVIDKIKGDTEKTMDDKKKKIENILDAIKDKFSDIWDNIKSLVDNAINNIKNIISDVMDAIKGVFSAVWEIIKGIFIAAMQALRGDVDGAMETIKSAVSNAMETIRTTFSNLWNTIKGIFTSALDNITSSLGTKFSAMVTNVRNKMNEVKTAISNKWDEVMSFLRGINLFQMGKDIIQGLVNGIKNMGSTLVESAKGVVNNAIDGAKNLLGIRSPSRVFMAIGEDTGKGMAIGLDKKGKDVRKAAERMADEAIVEIPDPDFEDNSNMFDTGVMMIQSLMDGIDFMEAAMLNKVETLVENASEAIQNSLKDSTPVELLAGIGTSGVASQGPSNATALKLPDLSEMANIQASRNSPRLSHFLRDNIRSTQPVTEQTVVTTPITIENAIVREDADINRIAEQLYTLQRQSSRGF